MLQAIVTAFFRPGGPYLYVRLVTASYAISAIARLIPVKSKQVPGYRPRVPAVVWYGATTLAALVVVACAFMLSQASGPAQRPVAALSPPAPPAAALPHVRAGFHLGVFEPGETVSYRPVTSFAAAAGREPDIVLYYSGWGEPFLRRFAETAYAHGAEPLVQIYPPPGGLAQLAAGRHDGYLRAYAAQVRSFGHPVLLSFAPEPNGPWYPWGWTRTPAKTWVAAWRHVVTAFRAAGATNVTWLLTLNVAFPGSGPVSGYWPGASYVDWVGIDGYYVRPRDTFQSRFMPTIRAVRKLTHKPLLIAEAAVGPAAGQIRGIRNLFAAIRRHQLTGLVWFDMHQHHGINHQNWRLEDNPAALAAFRRQARGFGRPLPG
jgi:mannan endo-1,4-beta-mannosidase